MSKKILAISRHAPYGQSIARDALDAILAGAIFDQELSVLFMDDGVFQLLKDQDAAEIRQKNIAASLSALPLYGVEKIFVHCQSLEMRKITPSDLIFSNIEVLDNHQIANLINTQDQLLSF